MSSAASTSGSHPNLLVVDDDELICEMMSDILTSLGYEVTCSQSIEAATKIVQGKSFSGYLLDYRLPDGTGLDFAKTLRDSKVTAPIILISGFADSDIAMSAQKVGVLDLVPKPFTVDQLKDIVERAIPKVVEKKEKEVVRERISQSAQTPKDSSPLKYLNTALLVAILLVLGIILTILILKL